MTLKEKFEDIEHLGLYKDEYSLPVWSTKVLDNQTSQCEIIADEFAIGFAEWCDDEGYTQINNLSLWKSLDDEKGKYSKQLLEIYKKEKGL
jgi:hypothetical protein